MSRHLVWLAAAILAITAIGQQTPSFDVASVKHSANNEGRHKGGGRGGSNDPSLFTSHNSTLNSLILRAYDLQEYQLSGGPAWMTTERYDIDARPDHPATPGQMMPMLRSLLVDRFQLTTRRETTTLPVYVITVAKGGPKFGPYFQRMKEGDPYPPPDQKRLQLGGSIKNFAFLLRANMRIFDPATGPVVPPADVPPILDRTGLDGEYNILISYDAQEDWPTLLERQLGLKLEARKEPVELLVVDHAAKPSEN